MTARGGEDDADNDGCCGPICYRSNSDDGDGSGDAAPVLLLFLCNFLYAVLACEAIGG